MTPLERLMAEGVPDGTFGAARPAQPRRRTPGRRRAPAGWTPDREADVSPVRAPQRKPARPALGTPLTDRQVQVIAGFARGHTSRQIGNRLGIGWQTVDDHRKRISAATGRPDRAGIVDFAYREGYLDRLPPEARPYIWLKPFEQEVLELLPLGLSDAAIGRRLFKSEGAVKSCVKRLFRKLGVAERVHAVAIGHQHGLLGGARQQQEAA